MKKVHLIFKTHLDLGFSDYAAGVIDTYFTRFIPQAIALARRTRESESRFRWTVGAWLMYHYLEQASPDQRKEAEDSIAAGDILWHALPFTTHTEMMDASLFRYGLTYSQRLDQRFGHKTIAAKMTDVPGHTRSIVPLLAEAGIKLLHIGVNEASTVPDVPPVFRWRDAESGAEILVVYDASYGGVTVVPGLDDVLALVLTNDNAGPPPDADISETYRKVGEEVPGAQVIASSLDAFATALDTVRDTLPVVTSEIGDTWIHGAGTDPTKVRRYRELARLRRQWLDRSLNDDARARIDQFSAALIMIPEHTWGMDEKTHLADHELYTQADLVKLRQTERGQRFEASWTEQQGYIDQALKALEGTALADEAETRLAHTEPKPWPAVTGTLPPNLILRSSQLELGFDPYMGAITHLIKRGSSYVWSSHEYPLALIQYETFGSHDYDRFWVQYNRNRDREDVAWWGFEDFTKPGLPTKEHQTWLPSVTAAQQTGENRVQFDLTLPDAAGQFGAPKRLTLEYALADDEIEITLSWFNKPANRQPEAFWLSFVPHAENEDGWRFEKMGRPVNPRDVVSRGARTLHAIDQKLSYRDQHGSFELTSLDAPLVAPGQRSLLNFHNRIPEMHGGVHINLYNNIWGTNFPMWFEGDAVFRFKLRID